MPYAYFYGRVSHANSANKKDFQSDVCDSVDHQFAMIERLRLAHALQSKPVPEWAPRGWISRKKEGFPTADGRYVDQEVSAYKVRFRERPAGERLHLALQSGDTLYVAYMHRAFRGWKDFAWMLDHWHSRNIRVVFATPEIDLATPAGELLAGVLSMMDGFMSQMLSDRLRTGARLRREAGLSTGLHARRGWKHVKRDGKTYSVPDDELREAQLWSLELRAQVPRLNWLQIADIIEQRLAAEQGRPAYPDYPLVGYEQRQYPANTLRKMYERRDEIPLPSRLLPPGTLDVPLTRRELKESRAKERSVKRLQAELNRQAKIAERTRRLIARFKRSA